MCWFGMASPPPHDVSRLSERENEDKINGSFLYHDIRAILYTACSVQKLSQKKIPLHMQRQSSNSVCSVPVFSFFSRQIRPGIHHLF